MRSSQASLLAVSSVDLKKIDKSEEFAAHSRTGTVVAAAPRRKKTKKRKRRRLLRNKTQSAISGHSTTTTTTTTLVDPEADFDENNNIIEGKRTKFVDYRKHNDDALFGDYYYLSAKKRANLDDKGEFVEVPRKQKKRNKDPPPRLWYSGGGLLQDCLWFSSTLED